MARILLIDDDDAYLAMLRTSLEERGHLIVAASEGNAGITNFRSRKFDLVITDILMPKKDGVETIIELRRIDPSVRIIAISGGGHLVPAQNCIQIAKSLGVHTALEKPFSVDTLQACIVAELA